MFTFIGLEIPFLLFYTAILGKTNDYIDCYIYNINSTRKLQGFYESLPTCYIAAIYLFSIDTSLTDYSFNQTMASLVFASSLLNSIFSLVVI